MILKTLNKHINAKSINTIHTSKWIQLLCQSAGISFSFQICNIMAIYLHNNKHIFLTLFAAINKIYFQRHLLSMQEKK